MDPIIIKLVCFFDDVCLITPLSENRIGDHPTMSHKPARSFNDSDTVSIQPGNDQGLSYHQNRLCRLENNPCPSIVPAPVAQASPRWAILVVRSLTCALILFEVGCGQGQSGPREYSKEEAQAQIDEALKKFPVAPPDTPEQIREKEAKVEESLPKVYELLEASKQDPKKIDEVVELSMSLLTLLPEHRAAKVAYGKAQLASFFAKEATDEHGKMLDQHHMGVAIRSASLEMDRLRKNHEDLSEEEVQLCQEIYFNRARMEGLYHFEPGEFTTTIGKLMSSGFNDVERLKAEPRFEYFFTDPQTAPVLQAAIAQIEGPAKEVPETDSSKDEASPQPE